MTTTDYVYDSDGGARLDAWLASQAGELSRTYAQKLLADGLILVNGESANKNYKLRRGDMVSVTLPEPPPADMPAQDIALDIVYEDAHIIVINKPRGMVVHPGSGNRDGTLVNALIFHCRGGLSDINGAVRPGIVHRLDKDTSGLIVAAKTNTAHRKLAAGFKSRDVRKIYNAIVQGHVGPDRGRIEFPITRHGGDRTKMAVAATGIGGKDAITLFKVIKRLPGPVTWLEVEILTGRTHQIRVHLAHIGHPVVGDAVYGGKRNTSANSHTDAAAPAAPTARGGQILHATVLEFNHPATGERLCFTSPLPEYFNAYFDF